MNIVLMGHIRRLSGYYRITLVVNALRNSMPDLPPDIEVISLPLMREISPTNDLRALWTLTTLFRRRRFDAVQSWMPKAGLLTMTAGFLARVPVRIHMFTGQVWATQRGVRRLLLRALDKVFAMLATHVLVDGPDQREFLIREGITSRNKSRILANGSSCGVDLTRFHPNPEARARIRDLCGIPPDAPIFLFVGRLKIDKGVFDLATAFATIGLANTWLIVAGPDEEGLLPELEKIVAPVKDRFRYISFADRPEEFMSAADVLCLPSYREGFNNVVLEAGAVGLPVLGSRIYGITDAIGSDETGILHEPANPDDLRRKMTVLASDPPLRQALGHAARLRVEKNFSQEIVTAALLDFYRSVLN